MIGAELVAKVPPNCYNLLIVPATHSVNQSLYKKMAFDTARNFSAIVLVMPGPFVPVIHVILPFKNVKELIAQAKARQGQLNYASDGVRGLLHLTGELFKSITGVQITNVPCRGAAPATVELVGSHVPIMLNNMLSAVPHIKAARLRALRYIIRASFSQKRMHYKDQDGRVVYPAKACPGRRSENGKSFKVSRR